MSLALSWSGGKDAAWALHLLRQQGEQVAALITTVISGENRVAMHRLRRSVVRQQAALVDLPLVEIELPWPCSDDFYQFAVSAAIADLAKKEGITGVAYGDLFLSDVRRFREELMGRIGLAAVFPLWGIRTDLLAQRMIRAGVEAYVVCVDPRRLERSLAGARWDAGFIRRLPPEVDPCGERGEFHTIITNGPMFAAPLDPVIGAVAEVDGFVFADLDLAPALDR
jgi:uncharacterized protein (TIGR00290 family)